MDRYLPPLSPRIFMFFILIRPAAPLNLFFFSDDPSLNFCLLARMDGKKGLVEEGYDCGWRKMCAWDWG
jgi:hypothetical protein